MRISTFFIVCMLAAFSGLQAQTLQYEFKNTLSEESGAGPNLNQLGTGSFISDSLSEISCVQRYVYNFPYNNGLQFDNAAAGNFLGETYSIEMYFKFLVNTGFNRVIDFKNRTQDQGVYATPSTLGFFEGIDIQTPAFVSGQYVYLCITRDSATQNVNIYIDGVFSGNFTDSLERGTIDSSQVLNFFQDDLVFGGEAAPGNLAFLKLHTNEISAGEVATSFASLNDTLNILTYTQDINASCLTGNEVNFTNTSENDSTGLSYNWIFGDGNSFIGTDATYSYTTAGNFTIGLVATQGTGCQDTTFSQIEIYADPIVDLGTDSSACAGDVIQLDAGGPYVSYLWNDGSQTQTISTTTGGTFIVTVTDSNGCNGSDTISVTINPNPLISLPGDSVICSGDTIQLLAPPGMTSYLWSTGETTQSIAVSTSGIFAASITNAAGCSASDTMEVTVQNPIQVSLGADTSLCAGSTLVLDAGIGFIGYLWNDSSQAQTLDVSISGMYYVQVTDAIGCLGSDTINVLVNPTPAVDLGPDGSICGGTQLTLDAGSGFAGYLWNDGSTTQTIDISTGGTFTVTVTDVNSCVGTDTISFIVSPLINLGPDVLVCNGTPQLLDAGPGLASYLWSTGETTQSILVSTSGNIGLSVTDSSGCINSDSVLITFSTTPVVALGADIIACQNETVILDAGSGFAGYLWNDGSFQSTLNVTSNGTYTVTVSNSDGCTGSDSIAVAFVPNPVVTLYGDTTLCDGNTLILDADTIFAGYLWSDGSFDHFITVTSAGTYWVEVADINGCTGSDTIVVSFYAQVPVPVISQINSSTLQSSSPTGNQWYQVPGGLIAGATGQTYSPPQNGTFYVIVTDVNGCESAPSPDFGFINTGIHGISGATVSVYPNPVSNNINIVSNGIPEAFITVTLMNLAGKIIMTGLQPANQFCTINVEGVASGTYYLRLETGSGHEIRRIVIAD
jgi:hypothetical protein